MYYYITEMILSTSSIYRSIETREGKETALRLLTESMVIFRRQVKYDKISLSVIKETIYTDKNKTELIHHLEQLLSLNYEISNYAEGAGSSGEFERKLINGQGYHKILKLKGAIIKSLYNFGCKNEEDKEEIFNESLIVFWQKLMKNEIGFFISGKADKADNYHVYNKSFYQNSKLSTYLTGIAKNIFLNRIKSYKISEPVPDNLPSVEFSDPAVHPSENPLLFMFLYYRAFMEPRKLRTVISILQYDCNLEDKEVRQVLGINNARIHSCRLRNNFHEWYSKNRENTHFFFDKATVYLNDRESKTNRLNEKIRAIASFRQSAMIWKVDLGIFREEFRNIDDFKKFHQVFRYLFYLSYTGKPSSLAGLPDEKLLRRLMDIFKYGLFGLPGLKSLVFLFYYGSDEPGNAIINILKDLRNELAEADQYQEGASHLAGQLDKETPFSEPDLSNKIYETNCRLFSHFTSEKEFINLISQNETSQRAF